MSRHHDMLNVAENTGNVYEVDNFQRQRGVCQDEKESIIETACSLEGCNESCSTLYIFACFLITSKAGMTYLSITAFTNLCHLVERWWPPTRDVP